MLQKPGGRADSAQPSDLPHPKNFVILLLTDGKKTATTVGFQSTLAKTDIIYPKNVDALIAMNFP